MTAADSCSHVKSKGFVNVNEFSWDNESGGVLEGSGASYLGSLVTTDYRFLFRNWVSTSLIFVGQGPLTWGAWFKLIQTGLAQFIAG